MKRLFSAIAIFLFFLSTPALLNAEGKTEQATTIHHNLKIVLYPKEHRFTVEDTITIPEHFPSDFHFFLHAGLNPVSTTSDVKIISKITKKEDASVEFFTAKAPHGVKTL
jgi:hypothetical protein